MLMGKEGPFLLRNLGNQDRDLLLIEISESYTLTISVLRLLSKNPVAVEKLFPFVAALSCTWPREGGTLFRR
jgi:hypothetical protein